MKRLAERGLTLAEAVVSAVLALVLGLLMVKLLTSGLGAHRKGAESRDAQAGVRTLVSTLVSELRSSTPPPLAEPLVMTPVFWPGVWGADQELASTSGFYERLREPGEFAGTEVDAATNRLVYVRMAAGQPDFTAGPLAAFALVELFVPEDKPHQVERRIHRLVGLDVPVLIADVTGADSSLRKGWLLDIATLLAQPPSAEPDIIFDSGPGSRVAFRVSHRTFKPAGDPGRTRFPQNFEPGVFKIEVAVAIDREDETVPLEAWPQKVNWGTLREETTELRIPSVRQN